MPNIVISDTSILILFHKINEFSLLKKVYGALITTPEIATVFDTRQNPEKLKNMPSVCRLRYFIFIPSL